MAGQDTDLHVCLSECSRLLLGVVLGLYSGSKAIECCFPQVPGLSALGFLVPGASLGLSSHGVGFKSNPILVGYSQVLYL